MRALLLERGPEIRRRILLVIVVGVPVVFLRTGLDAFNVPKLSLLIAGTIVVACIRIAEILQGAEAGGLRRVMVPALILSVPLLISSLASPYRGWTLFGLYPRFQGLIPYLAAILLGVLVADAFVGRLRELAWAFVIAGGVVAVYGLMQVVKIDPFEWASRAEASNNAISTLGNSNFAGAFLGIVLPVALVLLITEQERRWWAAGLLGAIFLGWLVTRSRGGWAAGVAGVAVTGGFLLSARWGWTRLAGAAVAVLAVGLVVGVVVISLVSPKGRFSDSDFEVRGHWWEAAAGMAGDAPVFGRGPNTFALEGIQHRSVDDAVEREIGFADDPHSVLFALLAGAGFVGAAAFVAVAAWAALQGMRVDAGNLFGAAFLGSIAAYFVQSFGSIDEMTLRVALWVAIGGLAASLAVAPETSAPPRRRKKRKGRPARDPLRAIPAVVAAGAVALAAVGWSIAFVAMDARAAHAVALFAEGQPFEGKDEFENVLGFRDENEYRERYGFLAGQIAVRSEGEIPEFIEATEDAYSYLDDFPDWRAHYEYALILFEMSQVDAADAEDVVAQFERLIEIDPLNPRLRLKAALAFMALDRHDQAIAVLQPAIELVDDSHPEIYGALGLAHARAGDADAALAAIEQALDLDKGEANALRAQALLRREQGS